MPARTDPALGSIADELRPLLGEQANDVVKSPRPALILLEMQSVQVNALFKDAKIPPQVYAELIKLIRDVLTHLRREPADGKAKA